MFALSNQVFALHTEVYAPPLSTSNGRLTISMVKDVLFDEEAQKREIGTTDQSKSQALVSIESRERGRCHHKGTGKGRPRSQLSGRTLSTFTSTRRGI